MPVPKIAAVATATPPQWFSQAELLALAGYDDPQRRGFFSRSDIEGRHLYIDPATFRPDESVDQLQERFRRGALATQLLWCHPIARHDGPLSVRRAYSCAELRTLAGKAGLARFDIREYPIFGRLVAVTA